MNVLVIGATGPTGREIVSQALAAGHSVTALARDPARLGIENSSLRVVTGDVLDPSALPPAVEGQDAVVSALGSGFTLRHTTLVSDGTRNVIEAMKTAGVGRLVSISAFGVGDSAGHSGFVPDRIIFPTLLRQLYADKDRQEDEVRRSGLQWMIVRPARLTNKPATGQYRASTDMAAVKPKTIARADVAAFCVSQLDDDVNLGRAVGLSS
jgi:putative NADH-flavin reductase